MDRSERFYLIRKLLASRRVVSREAFLAALEVSLATFKRDIEYLRDRFNAPIVYDAQLKGYRLDEAAGKGVDLPGMWFNAQEAYALLTIHQLLDDIAEGVIGDKIAPLKDRVAALLSENGYAQDQIKKRVKIIHLGQRPLQPQFFQILCYAVLARQQVNLVHYHRQRNEESARRVSPLRIVFYRDNWYVDTWCHVRDALRCFSMAALRDVQLLSAPAQDVADEVLDAELGAGYGIFSGSTTQTAQLKFSSQRARWVVDERWHPAQQGSFQDDGSYILALPYSDTRELIMDILKHGNHVEVIAPKQLRIAVKQALQSALTLYQD